MAPLNENVTETNAEILASVTTADGRVVDLGCITSPYGDRVRNAVWKAWKTRQIRKALGR